MEAIRAASAALASTSGPCGGPSEALSLKLNAAASYSPSSERKGLCGKRRVKQQQCRFRVVKAVARNLMNLNGSSTVHVNGAKVEGASKLGIKIDVPTSLPPIKLESSPALNKVIAAMAAAILEIDKRKKDEEKGVDNFGRGKLVENDFVYRQTFVIRSYEVGFDRTASIETLTNLFQGDVVEIDTWVAAEGKNAMRRDWLVTDYRSGEILARATSTWVTMNQDTRRLSKMPDDVRGEISPYFLDRWVMKDEPCRRIKKLGDDAPYIRSDLVPRLNDMDMNQHVNNVKYIGWVLESVPQSLCVAHELTSMVLEYKRECSPSDMVQSMTSPDMDSPDESSDTLTAKCPLLDNAALDGSPGAVSCSSGALKFATPAVDYTGPLNYTHLLRLQCDGAEIVRGRTVWRLKKRMHCSGGLKRTFCESTEESCSGARCTSNVSLSIFKFPGLLADLCGPLHSACTEDV